MKEVKIGAFYGQDIVIKIQDELYEEKDWTKSFIEMIESERKRAVEEYKDEQTISWMKKMVKRLTHK